MLATIIPPIRATCPYCGVGSGILVTSGADGVSVSGDPDHPANFGRLCSKGSALAETLGTDGRLTNPNIGPIPTRLDEVLGLIAQRFWKPLPNTDWPLSRFTVRARC